MTLQNYIAHCRAQMDAAEDDDDRRWWAAVIWNLEYPRRAFVRRVLRSRG